MTKNDVVHGTFSIERIYAASPARVFAAFADPAVKRRWFADGPGFETAEFTTDFRVGGGEKTRFRFVGGVDGGPPVGTRMGNDTVYLDIVDNERIVFAYTMRVEDKRMSASLATVVLTPSGSGTQLTFTEQAAFFDRADGPQLREEGWTGLLKKIDEAVKTAA
jgi:uncharacterized protein YndB with AHSA1/START domain